MKLRQLTPFLAALAAFGLLFVSAGCDDGSKLSKDEEQKFKEAVDNGKGQFDINKVPPEHRERVRGFMGNQGAASAPGAKPAAPAPGASGQ